MFDAIEDIPTHKLLTEIRYRDALVASALVEIAQELEMGENADFKWVCGQVSVLREAIQILHRISN